MEETKMKKNFKKLLGVTAVGAGLFLANPLTAEAHCDTEQGPVYDALQTSLEERSFDYIAHWVPEADEAELKTYFERTMSVKNKTKDAEINDLADDYLFENFVRIHRTSEGAPYTGISHEPVDPGVAAADESIEQESLAPLEEAGFVTDDNREHVEEVFTDLLETKIFETGDTEAGRAYVENYVTFTHLFEEGHDEAHEEEGHKEEQDAHTEEVNAESEETEGNWFTQLFSDWF
ncbi:hypothetical protein KV134_11480 [Tetragenococcus halophilus]|nr:hypothetical protein [Desemzia sp. RIT 804]NWO01238.1 hypothetical protein [Tetragenococcus halophilus]RQD29681.1 hypothetical protein C7K42_12605 [Tetragenococcus halophilus subsp. halophilus DSM 20339]MBM6614101.1 hypothetical protein [Desemzia sp. RIT 804]MBM6614184.1 hypothetical protein [Desemzia sp. RIT 804]